MTVYEHSEEIEKLEGLLGEICRPYGVRAEVIRDYRAKKITTDQEELEGASVYEIDSEKFISEDLGYAVILSRENDSSKWSEIDLEELKNKLLKSDLSVCRIALELAKK